MTTISRWRRKRPSGSSEIPMTKHQIPNKFEIQRRKFKTARAGRFEFWIFVIGICLGFGALNLVLPARAQEIRLRRTPAAPPRGPDGKTAPAVGAPNVVRGDEITP